MVKKTIILIFVSALTFLSISSTTLAEDGNKDISNLSPADQAKHRAYQKEIDRLQREIERHEKSLDEELREMQQQADRLERQNNGR